MRRLSPLYYFMLLFLVLSLYSCSTVRLVPQGQSVLKENNIKVVNNETINTGKLNQYIRQQPNNSFLFGWNPFVVIYNWSNGKNNGWDKFVKKVGQQPVILDHLLVERSSANLRNHLSSMGYYGSTVDDTIITKKKKSKVYYSVKAGNPYIVKDIFYSIRDTAIERIVMNNLSNSLIKTDSRLSEQTLDLESDRLTTILRENGYYNFTKNYFLFEADTLKRDGTAQLLVKIENYTRNETPKDARDHQLYSIRNISLFSDYDPMRGREETLANYDVIKTKYLDIYNRDSRSIKPAVLAKMNTLRPGELYNEKKANNTYNRYVSLRYFSGVNIQFDEVEADSTQIKREVDCTIRLTPSKNQGYKLNLEASSNSNKLLGISPAISYYHKNLFKGGEWFTLGIMGNFQFKLNDPVRSTELGVSAGLSIPSFLLLPDSIFTTNVPRTDINIGYNYQSRPEFTRNLISLNYGYSWRSGKRMFYSVNPVQLNVIKLYNMDPKFYQSLMDPFLKNSYRNHFDFGSGASIYYTTDASPMPQSSFFYIRWNNDIAGNLLSIFDNSLSADTSGVKIIWNTPYAQYFRTDFTLGYTYKPYPSYAVATRFNLGVGYAYGNSRVLPFEKLFYAGGANSLRGWQARSVGPGSAAIDTTFSIPNQTGDVKLEFNVEYRFNMFWNFEGALFLDAGNIWTLRSDLGNESGLFRIKDFYKSMAVNWGAGLRLNLDFVVLRLDLGMIAHDPVKKTWIGPSKWFRTNTYTIQFGVGYPF